MWAPPGAEFLFRCETVRGCPKPSSSCLLLSGCCRCWRVSFSLLWGQAVASLLLRVPQAFSDSGKTSPVGTACLMCSSLWTSSEIGLQHLPDHSYSAKSISTFFFFFSLVFKPYWPLCLGGTSSHLTVYQNAWFHLYLFSSPPNRVLPCLPGGCPEWYIFILFFLGAVSFENFWAVVWWPALPTCAHWSGWCWCSVTFCARYREFYCYLLGAGAWHGSKNGKEG